MIETKTQITWKFMSGIGYMKLTNDDQDYKISS